MFAVINIATDSRKGFFAGLLQYFSPSVIKSIVGDIPVYDVKVPIYSVRGVSRCRKKLVSELKNDGIDRFLCSGGWKEIISEEGFAYVRYKPFLLRHILPAVLNLCKKAGEFSEEFHVVLHDSGVSSKTKDLFAILSEKFRNVTLITENTEAYADIQNEIAGTTGAATIVTDSFAAVNDAQIIISLTDTYQIFNKGRVKSCTLILTADDDFTPSGYLGASVINAYSPALTEEQMRLCKGSISPWELSAALDSENLLKNKEITEYYSFGRYVSADNVIQDLVRKFRLINDSNPEKKEALEPNTDD